jgi:hypothetical protein
MRRSLVTFVSLVSTAPLALLALAASPGCITGTPDDRAAAERSIKRHVSREAPTPDHRLGVRFGTKVELLGYDFEPAQPSPGDAVRLTWYWHCLEPLEGDWLLFTHLVDPNTGGFCDGCNFDESTLDNLRHAYPPGRWRAGDYITDVQRVALPEDISFVEAEFRVGVYRGDERLEVTAGPHDNQRRARGPRFPTGYEPPPLPELVVPRLEAADGQLAIDGRLDEAPWARAARTPAFVNATDGGRGQPTTTARLLHDGQRLYIGFECDDDNLHSTFTKRDDPLWNQDAVETFIDPPGTGRDYLEFQVSPAGLLFDSKIAHHPQRDDSYDGGATAAVQRRGTLNDDSDVDQGWTAELAIPLDRLAATLPTPGQQWRLNLFRLDDRRGGRRAFLGWSPPMANTTHVTERFGRITFGPAPEAPAQTPSPAAAAEAAAAEAAASEPSEAAASTEVAP